MLDTINNEHNPPLTLVVGTGGAFPHPLRHRVPQNAPQFLRPLELERKRDGGPVVLVTQPVVKLLLFEESVLSLGDHLLLSHRRHAMRGKLESDQKRNNDRVFPSKAPSKHRT